MWMGGGDREKRQRISHELRQLKQMSESLRTKALRSFTKRAADERPARGDGAPAEPLLRGLRQPQRGIAQGAHGWTVADAPNRALPAP